MGRGWNLLVRGKEGRDLLEGMITIQVNGRALTKENDTGVPGLGQKESPQLSTPGQTLGNQEGGIQGC